MVVQLAFAYQMDSLVTLYYPILATLGYLVQGQILSYGLRHQYRLFRQLILGGFHHEQTIYWLTFENLWEIEWVHVLLIKLYGNVKDEQVKRLVWILGEMVEAVAYDNPIPGYGTRNTINL